MEEKRRRDKFALGLQDIRLEKEKGRTSEGRGMVVVDENLKSHVEGAFGQNE